jgi:Protein of unknown function (DUF3667)
MDRDRLSPPTGPALSCLNCGAALAGAAPRFCAACGQETNVKPPTLSEFAQQFGGAYFATEGALWRTLKLLLFKPGELTRQYLAGRRKHYVLPLRLYLTISVLVLLALRLSATIAMQSPGAVKIDGNEARSFRLDLGPARAGLREGVFYCEKMPEWLCKRIQRRIDIKPEAMVDMARQLGERFVGNLGAAMFVLLPSLALFLKWAYFNRRLRYTEHLVFALHVHAFWFVMIGLTLLPWGWINGPALLAVPIYTLLAMRRVYGGRWWPLLLRALVVSFLYLVPLLLAMATVALWSLLA